MMCHTYKRQMPLIKTTNFIRKHNIKFKCNGKSSQKQTFPVCDKYFLRNRKKKYIEYIPETMQCSVVLTKLNISKYYSEKNIGKKVTPILPTDPISTNNGQKFIVKKFEPVSPILEQQVSNVQDIRSKKSSLHENNKISDINIFIDKHELGRSSTTQVTPKKQTSNVQQIIPRRKHSISETKYSAHDIKIPILQKSESVEKLLTTPEKQISYVYKIRSRRCYLHEAQDLSNSQPMTTVTQLESAEIPPMASSKQKCILQKIKSKMKGSARNIPVDDISFRRNSSHSYKDKSDCITPKKESRKTKFTKKSTFAKTKREPNRTKKGKKLKSTKQKTRKISTPQKIIPVDDIAKAISLSPLRKSKSLRSPYKKILVRKRQKEENNYEDDIYEFKNFDKFKELLVDTSISPVSSSMPTPELGIHHLNPLINEKSPKYEDCISQEDFSLFRKVAEECIHQKHPEKIGCNADITITW